MLHDLTHKLESVPRALSAVVIAAASGLAWYTFEDGLQPYRYFVDQGYQSPWLVNLLFFSGAAVAVLWLLGSMWHRRRQRLSPGPETGAPRGSVVELAVVCTLALACLTASVGVEAWLRSVTPEGVFAMEDVQGRTDLVGDYLSVDRYQLGHSVQHVEDRRGLEIEHRWVELRPVGADGAVRSQAPPIIGYAEIWPTEVCSSTGLHNQFRGGRLLTEIPEDVAAQLESHGLNLEGALLLQTERYVWDVRRWAIGAAHALAALLLYGLRLIPWCLLMFRRRTEKNTQHLI